MSRIVYMGSPGFAATVLQGLLDAGVNVVGVVTQPDRPAGRGNALRAPAVKVLALSAGLNVIQPLKVRDGSLAAWIRSLDADLAIVAAYGRILVPDVLNAPRLGCVNVHASLLPRWRGASPITRAIAAGDEKSGVCLMRMEEGLDTGPVLARVEVPILDTDTTSTLEERLADAGARLLAARLDDLLNGRLAEVPQDDAASTHAPPLQKAEGRIDWSADARQVHAHIRAMQPWPGAWTEVTAVGGEHWKVAAEALAVGDHAGEPGTLAAVDKTGVWVCCGRGSVRLTLLQRPDRRAMPAPEVLRGARLLVGARLGATEASVSTANEA
jgi:methionyl-tRNA formyltransferase